MGVYYVAMLSDRTIPYIMPYFVLATSTVLLQLVYGLNNTDDNDVTVAMLCGAVGVVFDWVAPGKWPGNGSLCTCVSQIVLILKSIESGRMFIGAMGCACLALTVIVVTGGWCATDQVGYRLFRLVAGKLLRRRLY
jgi:hypothetical protein